MSKAESHLKKARQEIDQVDGEILAQMGRLLGRRMEVARAVGALKESDGGKLLDPEREKALLETWAKHAAQSGISQQLAMRVLREILVHSRRTQERVLLGDNDTKDRRTRRVAYWGKLESAGDLACAKLFDTRCSGGADRVGYATLAATVEAVRSGKTDYALVPVENSLTGSSGEIEHYLVDSDLAIVDEEVWESTQDNGAGRFLEVWDTSPARVPDVTRFLLLGPKHEPPGGSGQDIAPAHPRS